MKGLPVDWTKGLPADKKEDFEALLRNSGTVLRRFRQLIEDKERSICNLEISQDAYDNPSWAYQQADRNGAKRVLKQLKQLLDFLE